MLDYRNIIKNREFRLKIINLLRFIPDKPYLKMVYRIKTGKKLNLDHPVTFCDKLNWLKIHDQHPEYTELVDKVLVHDYLKRELGEDIGLPVLGVWKHYDDIDFSDLPDTFVLKCNHDSASVKIIRDKNAIDHTKLKEFYEGRLRINSFNLGREYPYKNVQPVIFAERFMTPEGADDLLDYKFLCFDGVPKVMSIVTGRSQDCRIDFFNMDFQHLDMTSSHPQSGKEIKKPDSFEEMKELASRLSRGMKFVRIDLYEIKGKVYFGEFTFFQAGGFWPMKPEKWEKQLGEWINIGDSSL